jgi:glycosyltransferase involved in cell wall biosynthesis
MTPESHELHIGFLCDYGATLMPRSGIGVFVYNLIDGLLTSQPSVRVTVLVAPRDLEDLQYLARRWTPRVRILSSAGSPFLWTERLKRFVRLATAWRDRAKRWRQGLARGLSRCMRGPLRSATTAWGARRQRPAAALGRLGVQAVMLLPLVPLGVVAGVVWGLGRIIPFAKLFQPAAAALGKLKRMLRRVIERRVKPYGCDVWLVPFVGLKARLALPSVLVVHDIVWDHFPDCMDASSRLTMESLVPRRTAEATLCACMSSFIRDTDLLGVLGLPPEKVRLVPPAPPADFPEVDQAAAERLKPAALTRPFLLYPAAFRSYKNHRTLIEALRVLRDTHGVDDLDLAFTGENTPPAELLDLVQAWNLQGRVHFLGCVERATLAALYRMAFATVMPSLYEQGSFPVYEALHWGCPVACSDIPPLREQCAAMGDAMQYFDPRDAASVARAVVRIRADRAGVIAWQQAASRPMWRRTWAEAAGEWLAVFHEAIDIDRWQKYGVDHKQLEPWPRLPQVQARPQGDCRSLFLFLQVAYAGGVWETTKELVQELVALNRVRGRFQLTLGIHEDQDDARALEGLGNDLRLQRFRLNPIHRPEVVRMMNGVPAWLADRPEYDFCFFGGAALAALQADAWLGLVDRFPLPLLPARPYGVVVYDMIQRAVPEAFDAVFFRSMKVGMRPTLHAADLVLVTSPQTRTDVIAEFALDPARVVLAPLACNPQRRFGGVAPAKVSAAREPFVLNTSNISRHKGIEVLLRGHARLKEQLGKDCPLLVICGVSTHKFSARAGGPHDPPECRAVRRLVRELGFEEGRDVVFLGFVRDAELLDLYQRCAAVVNAARYDNGSFLLTEGAYFGCRCVSSRYPAVEYLCRRFGVPAYFFDGGDPEALASTLHGALRQPPPTPAETACVRARFLAPEFSVRRYAERIYEAMSVLAAPAQPRRIHQQDRLCA